MHLVSRASHYALFILIASICLQAGASSQIPEALILPDGARLLFTAHAEGVQIYVSKAHAGGGKSYEWVLDAPDAILYDEAHRRIGKHYAGPTWETTDGSEVVGEPSPKQLVKSRQAGALPWLLLKAKSHEGAALLGITSYILQIDTVGGAAPAKPPNGAGQQRRIKYTATYIFLTDPGTI